MTKNSTRRGLAWGAAISLVATLFAATPAQADENLSLTTLDGGTITATFVDEQFTVVATALNSATRGDIGLLAFQIEKPASAGVLNYSTSSIARAGTLPVTTNAVTSISAAATTSVVLANNPSATAGQVNALSIRFGDAGTTSASVTVTVTAFIDGNNNGSMDAGEARAALPITFTKYSEVKTTVALASAPIVGDTTVKATGALVGINTKQLSRDTSISLTVASAAAADYSIVAGSVSDTVTALVLDDTVSAQVKYNGVLLDKAVTAKAKAATIDEVTMSPVASANAVASGSNDIVARINSEFSVTVKTLTTSSPVASIPVDVTVAVSGLTTTKTITLNGTAYTDSARIKDLELTTGTNGAVTFTIKTTGFAGGETITINAVGQNVSANQVTAHVEAPVFTVVNDEGNVRLATLGASVAMNFSVEDQWESLSTRPNQRVKFALAGTGFTSKLAEVNVVAGKASANLALTPTTVSGTLTVFPTLQEDSQFNGNYTDVSGASATTVSVVVTSASAALKLTPKASYSASVSYAPTYSYVTIAAGSLSANVGGATIQVSGEGFVFRYDKKTFSGTVAVATDATGLSTKALEFAHTIAGSHTLSFTVGAATSQSSVIVDPAAGDAGKTITFDASSIPTGQTSTITGKLVDANGNPVMTTGSAYITLAWTGKGLPFGTTGTIETDKDGEFSFNVLALPGEMGAASITAVYYKSGAGTAAKDLISVTQPITIGAAATAPASNQKLTVGSFKGFVAIYALNYTGSKLSAKVAGKWLVENNLSRFERVVRLTGAAIPIVVDLYIDGKFVRTENIVTK